MISIALVGNPNCGKTTLFNRLTNSKEHVGNYSGVTVGASKSTLEKNGYHFDLTDLPGTYSLTSYTPEELYTRNFILQEMPDIVVNVVDASNMERNLFLTSQLIDMDIKVVIALNMYDDLLAREGFYREMYELQQREQEAGTEARAAAVSRAGQGA